MDQETERVFTVARSVKGFMPENEGEALYRAGTRAADWVARPAPFLEIGTYCGKSALYLGAAARAAGRVVFSVDHHRGSEENQPGWEHHDPDLVDAPSGLMDTLPHARRAVEQASLGGTVVLVVGSSSVVAAAWTTELSLLFIDGGHGAEVAWSDYATWTPRLAVGGLLAIHDVFPDPADGGRPPYELYCAARSSRQFEDCPGLACGSLRVLRRTRGGGAARPRDAASSV